jgi:hypothetical protein
MPATVFVGRDTLLETLATALRAAVTSGSPCRLALVGPEGHGKTAVLGELCRRLGLGPSATAAPPAFSDGVVWVSGKSPSALHRSFRALIADAAGGAAGDAVRLLTDDVVQGRVHGRMRARPAYLLVVDDVDALTAVAVGR